MEKREGIPSHNYACMKTQKRVSKLLYKEVNSKYFGLRGPRPSVTTTPFCHCIVSTAINNTKQIGIVVFQENFF